MTSYGSGRDQQYAAQLKQNIANFVAKYEANPADEHTTIFLFPGGLGSALMRAEEAAQNGPPFIYDPLWITCSILSGAVIDLQMDGVEDYLDQYILPNGVVDFVTLRPYDGFVQWCRTNAMDLFIFGWDWRRPVYESVVFFLQRFLPAFEAATSSLNPPPLENFWLLGHSFGGGVVKQILNQSANPYVQKMSGAITVGTPFYGFGGELHRFFVGEADLNGTLGVQGASYLTVINASLRAGYELLFLDQNTYNANANAFANDPEGYDLKRYPSLDAATGAVADPYHPIPGRPTQAPAPTDMVRYLSSQFQSAPYFNWDYLPIGHNASIETSQPLDASLAGKFWNVRGVQTNNGVAIHKTVVSQTWALVPESYVPDPGNDPISDNYGPGDDTIPAWSARLLGNPNVVTVANDSLEHMDLLNDGDIQQTIARILFPHGAARRRLLATARTVKMAAASRKDLNRFLDQIRKIDPELSRKDRKEPIRRIMQTFAKGDPSRLPPLLVRAYMDSLKSPSQILGRKSGRGK